MAGGDDGCPHSGGDGQWHLAVLVMDEDEATGNGHSMDEAMDFGEEVVRQRQQRLHLTVAGAGD